MADQSPLCVRCGYPARGLEAADCPECGLNRDAAPPTASLETARLVVSPRRGLLGLLWREQDSMRRAGLNVCIASTLAAAAVVWTWLIDPIRGSLAQPLSAVTTLFHLVFVVALALALLASTLIAFEHAAVLIVTRLMHVAKAKLLAWRISSISTFGLLLGGAATLALVAAVKLTGLEGTIADMLPAGGALAGMVAWMRSMAAGVWAAGLLRDAGW